VTNSRLLFAAADHIMFCLSLQHDCFYPEVCLSPFYMLCMSLDKCHCFETCSLFLCLPIDSLFSHVVPSLTHLFSSHMLYTQAAASVYTCAEPAASETPSLGASMLLGEFNTLFLLVCDLQCVLMVECWCLMFAV
jgi:hypothetical protein